MSDTLSKTDGVKKIGYEVVKPKQAFLNVCALSPRIFKIKQK